MIIQKLKQIVKRVDPITGVETAPIKIKQYLLLLYFLGDSDSEKDFEIVTGRKETFKYLLENIDSIDMMQSHVMPENMPLDEAITTYTFMRLCLEHAFVEEEIEELEFDVESLHEHMKNFYDTDDEKLDELYIEERSQEHKTK